MASKKGRSLANGEQQVIPEMAPTRIDKIHRAAKRYAIERDKRVAANAEEKAAHGFLLNVMKEQGLTHYNYGDLEVFVDTAEKCKVKTASESSNGDGGGDDEG